ncbi:MAG: 3-hydroxyacyl-CoA dehydrogenase NAD-binding domain-containing protein, partial [Actinomycetota bacterium]|nr:3-hydroxyacyl-CoA dehydrogenase NAD-binding domain-containing protein [Actinomycetota bacterium]
MFVHKAAVVGGGTMGGQIAQAIAASDTPVVIKDVDQKFVDHAIEEVKNVTTGQLAGRVKKGKMTQEEADARLAEVMGLVTGTVTYDEFGDVDFVIEAVPEKMGIKQAVFAELDAVTPGHAIISSNTSGLSISEMAEATIRPDKVVGFHFFYPASVMPLVEVIIGDETSSETIQVASNFAQAIGKQPITCGEVPGFVVNRILNSAVGEIWRAQEERGLSIKKIDEGVGAANVAPMGPFILVDMLGLDTVYHVAEHLSDSYGERFYVHQGMKQLVSEGKLGAKTGGEGLYKDGEPNVPGDADADAQELSELFLAKALIESCLLLEEGVCSVRDIDFGMMAGAGLAPPRGLFPPFWKADIEGLDVSLERIEKLNEKYGDERFPVPVVLKRLVAQGRLGFGSGQGFYPWPQADEGDQPEKVKLETRGNVAIAWLNNLPMNAISPQVIEDLGTVWERVKANEEIGAMIIASANPVVFSAGADIKAFTQLDTEGGAALINNGHELLKDFGSGRVVTIAAVNSLAFGGGCELAMACDFRIAAEAAVFGQPEVKLGIIPGFGGTQRLPRLVGRAKALEMNTVGDPISSIEALEFGLVNRVVTDQELFDVALNWGRRLAGQAPLAIEQIKQV